MSMNKRFLILSSSLIITACSTFSNQYTCGAIPNSGCTPVSEVYDSTSGTVYDYRNDLSKSSKKNNGFVNEDDYDDEEERPVINISKAHQSINYVNPGDPLLTKPVIMRVLFSGFENDQSDLDAGGYSYLKIKGAQWVLRN